MRTVRVAAICAVVLALVAGCSKKRDSSPFDPDGGHPETWVQDHPAAFQADSGSCLACHGKDLMGGISRVSCYGASFEGQSCHQGGPGGPHLAGWAMAQSHGSSAKASPGATSGFASCARCHGANFAGGSGLSCFGCHGWNAPHGKTGWKGGGSGHSSTNPGNTPVCAQCHRRGAGDPGCFNNTLCHGEKVGHPSGWENPRSHGAAAKDSPGMASCEACHGGSFQGGSGPACASCHGTSQPAPHPRAPWRSTYTHTNTNQNNAPVCAQCHRSKAGTAGCFNGTLCHAAAGNHPAGWASVSQHGAAAQANMMSCETCHGGNFAGGTSGQSCFPCHGWNAAHGVTGWIGGGGNHRINEGNAPACAVCHRQNAGTAGCFNNTLCHGAAGNHPAGWASVSQHGAAAQTNMMSCQACHGSNFAGGTSGQSCFPCHGWNAAHGVTGWNNGGSRHRVNSGNAPACAVCHRQNPGTAGCFNNTLCHGD